MSPANQPRTSRVDVARRGGPWGGARVFFFGMQNVHSHLLTIAT